MNSLSSKDDTIKRITLNLLYKNTNSNNLKIIADKFMESLKISTDFEFKKDITHKLFDLCIRYSRDT